MRECHPISSLARLRTKGTFRGLSSWHRSKADHQVGRVLPQLFHRVPETVP